MMTTQEVWLRLSNVKKLSVRRFCQLTQQLESERVIRPSLLRNNGLSEEQITAFYHLRSIDICSVLTWLEDEQHHLIAINSPDYPPLLKTIASPPRLLYVKGALRLLQSTQLAMIGSRNFSYYGEFWARCFATGLVNSGFTVTSGLAIGIDGICHQAALDAQGHTLAVLGSGLLHIYPKGHCPLAERILEQGGTLISEFPLSTPPQPHHFPRRNRIISGISAGVLVVEASLHSGSLITARCALEQGREVFALPGPLDCLGSQGTHWLIKQGAYLVTDPMDIAEHMGSGLTWLSLENVSYNERDDISNEKMPTEVNVCAKHTELELPFAEVLVNVGYKVTPVDVIAERAGQSVSVVVGQLLELELAGWITAVSGGYIRIKKVSDVRRTNPAY